MPETSRFSKYRIICPEWYKNPPVFCDVYSFGGHEQANAEGIQNLSLLQCLSVGDGPLSRRDVFKFGQSEQFGIGRQTGPNKNS